MTAISLKIKHGINHVLHDSWACYGSDFGHMPHKKKRYPRLFCHVKQPNGCFPDLGDTARGGGNFRIVNRLDGIHHHGMGFFRFRHGNNGIKVCFCCHQHGGNPG